MTTSLPAGPVDVSLLAAASEYADVSSADYTPSVGKPRYFKSLLVVASGTVAMTTANGGAETFQAASFAIGQYINVAGQGVTKIGTTAKVIALF